MSWHPCPNPGSSVDYSSQPSKASCRSPRTFASKRGLALCGLVALAFSLLAGCNSGVRETGPTGLVSGKVSVKGKPLAQGCVNFISDRDGLGATGNVKPDGTYTLEGPLPLGIYKVFITFNISPAQFGTPAADIVKTVPEKYLGQATSDLTAEVEEGKIEHDFDLK